LLAVRRILQARRAARIYLVVRYLERSESGLLLTGWLTCWVKRVLAEDDKESLWQRV
jgi:hypothetical protein